MYATPVASTGNVNLRRSELIKVIARLVNHLTAFEVVNSLFGANTSQMLITANTPKKEPSLIITSLSIDKIYAYHII
jgi:hypothetical protein